VRVRARGARGEARRAILGRLDALDATLAEAATAALPEAERTATRAEADSQLAPHRARMPAAEYERAVSQLAARLTRERFRLPVLRWE
jgi:hypothetical protein